MKTTVELSDSILREAKRAAAREHTTVRALVEEGLRLVLARRRLGKPFKLRKATFRGDGLQTGVSLRDWDSVRDLVYSGRGA